MVSFPLRDKHCTSVSLKYMTTVSMVDHFNQVIKLFAAHKTGTWFCSKLGKTMVVVEEAFQLMQTKPPKIRSHYMLLFSSFCSFNIIFFYVINFIIIIHHMSFKLACTIMPLHKSNFCKDYMSNTMHLPPPHTPKCHDARLSRNLSHCFPLSHLPFILSAVTVISRF